MRRKWILIFSIPVLLILISSYLFFSRHSFEDFAMDMFRREIASSTLDLHYTLTDPGPGCDSSGRSATAE